MRSRLLVVVFVFVIDFVRRVPADVRMVVAAASEKHGAPGQRDAGHQRQRKRRPIVAMELQFGQQVAGGDADETRRPRIPTPGPARRAMVPACRTAT